MTNPKLKIAFLHNDYPFGGAEKVTSDISRYFESKGHSVYMFVNKLNRQILSEQDEKVMQFVQLPDRHMERRVNARYIVQTIRELQIDILIVPVQMLPYLDYIRKKSGCKVVFAHHGMPFWELQNKLDNGRRKAAGSLAERIEWRFKLSLERKFGRYRRRFVKKYRQTLRDTDAFTVLCAGYKRDICEIIEEGRSAIFVLPNPLLPLNTHKPYDREKHNQLLYMGRLSYADKRVDRLIDIWDAVQAKHPDWELLIVGDGEEKQQLKLAVAEREIPRIAFHDHTANPSQYYDHAAILCMTSTFEGFGLVLAEAQQAGVIPVAFGCSDGVKSIIAPNGVNGILIAPFDMEAYGEQLDRLMSDPLLRKQLQDNVIKKSEEYDLERVGALWLKLFYGLLNEK